MIQGGVVIGAVITRMGAPNYARKPGSGLVVEPGADTGPGVREWLASVGTLHARAAAFDTRLRARPVFTGRASKGISRRFSGHGLTVVTPPESFLVDKKSHLVPGGTARARAWGAHLAPTIQRSQAGRV